MRLLKSLLIGLASGQSGQASNDASLDHHVEPPLQQADIMRGPVPDYSEDSAVTDLPVKESIYPGDDHYDPSDAGFVDGVTLNQPESGFSGDSQPAEVGDEVAVDLNTSTTTVAPTTTKAPTTTTAASTTTTTTVASTTAATTTNMPSYDSQYDYTDPKTEDYSDGESASKVAEAQMEPAPTEQASIPATPASPVQPSGVLESPDLIIAFDQHVGTDDSFDGHGIAANIIEKANEFFRIGGCLDELRVGAFQFNSETTYAPLNLGSYNRFMFDRSSCMENINDNTNYSEQQLHEDTVSPIRLMTHLEKSNSSDISIAVNEALDQFTRQSDARKGSVQRRLMRWGFSSRKVLVLLTGSQTGDMEQLAKQAKKADVEIIVVSKNMDNNDRLSVLAKETLRLEKFSPFILDAYSPDTPWLISAYLKNSQEVHKYATSKWSPPTPATPRTEDESNLNLGDFDLILKQNCKLNPCCCKKAQKIAQQIQHRRETAKAAKAAALAKTKQQ